MPIYYALFVGGVRKSVDLLQGKEAVTLIDLRNFLCEKYRDHVDSRPGCMAVYYVTSEEAIYTLDVDVTEPIQVRLSETIDTSSQRALERGEDGKGSIYLRVTAPAAPAASGTFVCAVPRCSLLIECFDVCA